MRAFFRSGMYIPLIAGSDRKELIKRFKSPRRQRYFHRQWGARGVVASVAAGQLTVNL